MKMSCLKNQTPAENFTPSYLCLLGYLKTILGPCLSEHLYNTALSLRISCKEFFQIYRKVKYLKSLAVMSKQVCICKVGFEVILYATETAT